MPSSLPFFSKPSPSTRSSLEVPLPETNVNNKNSFTTPTPPPNCTPPPQTFPSPRNTDQQSHSLRTARLQTSKRPKVVFIADSIGSIADVRHLEEATNTLIYSKKAYGASYKSDAYKPNENFVYVAKNAAQKRNYSFAVLQGSSTDITNLHTSSPNHNLEFLKQEVTIASKNMITAARNILLTNPGIQKVIILDRTPRFDVATADPFHLKSNLSEYGNRVFREELANSDVKNKVFIASHTLPQQFQQNLYGHPEQYNFDGIHFNGSDGANHYTRSLCNILQSFFSSFSREPHNHTIPIIPAPTADGRTVLPEVDPSATSSLPSAPPKSFNFIPAKPASSKAPNSSSVIIDIEPELCTPDQTTQYNQTWSYNIPTYNPFTVLGN